MKKNFNELLKRGYRKFYISIINTEENPVIYKKDGEPSPKNTIKKEFDFYSTTDRPDITPKITWNCGLESFGDYTLPSYSIGLFIGI